MSLSGTIESAPPPVTEAHMIRLLDSRYTRVRRGTRADRYVRAAHVRSTQWFGMADRICDYLVIDKYISAPQSIHGHEIKVSRADWLTELRNPEKAAGWKHWCNYWWLVVANPSIVAAGELPQGWGLMAPDCNGALRARTSPTYTETPDLPLDVVAGIAYAAQQKSEEPR